MHYDANQPNNICDLTYLNEMMFGNKEMLHEIINDFSEQTAAEMNLIQSAISNGDFPAIKRSAHKMKSAVGIMGISSLLPLLNQMEILGAEGKDIPRIRTIASKVNEICRLAIIELKLYSAT